MMLNNINIVIDTKHFILRLFTIEDAPLAYKNWANDPEVTQYLTWNAHESLDVTKKIIQQWIDDKSPQYAIIDRESNESVGLISLMSLNETSTIVEMGYCLGKKFLGKGYMTEIAQALVEKCYDYFQVDTIILKCQKNNIASSRVIQKLGFVYEKSEIAENKGESRIVYCYKSHKELYHTLQLTNKYQIVEAITNYQQLINYSQKHHLLVKTFQILNIDDLVINYSIKDQVIVRSDPYLVTVTFLGLIDEQQLFNQKISIFLTKYQQFIISEDDITISHKLVNLLYKHHWKISFSESCTGGMICSTLITVPGASNVIEESYVTYSEQAKRKILGVNEETLLKYSVYSKEVASEMVEGLIRISHTNVGISVTGLAGGNLANPHDGDFYYAIAINDQRYVDKFHFKGERNLVRKMQSLYILWKIYHYLLETFPSKSA